MQNTLQKWAGHKANTNYTSAHGSGQRYYILLLKFLSFFFFFFFPRKISEMALPTGNLSSSDGRI